MHFFKTHEKIVTIKSKRKKPVRLILMRLNSDTYFFGNVGSLGKRRFDSSSEL